MERVYPTNVSMSETCHFHGREFPCILIHYRLNEKCFLLFFLSDRWTIGPFGQFWDHSKCGQPMMHIFVKPKIIELVRKDYTVLDSTMRCEMAMDQPWLAQLVKHNFCLVSIFDQVWKIMTNFLKYLRHNEWH